MPGSKGRKRGRKDRRVYLRFSERDFALLQRMAVLDAKCIADELEDILNAAAQQRAREDWKLYSWWQDECFRISLEETNVAGH